MAFTFARCDADVDGARSMWHERPGVSQALVSLVERGHLDGVTIRTLRAIHAALDARLVFELRWRGGMLDRVSDEKHAAPREPGRGDSGRVGLDDDRGGVVQPLRRPRLDRHSRVAPRLATLLVIEVKTEVTSMEETQRRLDVKSRVAAEDRLRARRLAASRTSRRSWSSRRRRRRATLSVAFAATFATTFPTRGREIRTWLRRPDRADPRRLASFR